MCATIHRAELSVEAVTLGGQCVPIIDRVSVVNECGLIFVFVFELIAQRIVIFGGVEIESEVKKIK